VEETNVPDGNMLIEEVGIDLNMLGALVVDRVVGEVDSADVVTVDHGGLQQGPVQLHEQLTKLARLCYTIGHDTVLHLSAQMGDNVLALRGPGDEVVTQEQRA
jgi:hypothetical protein